MACMLRHLEEEILPNPSLMIIMLQMATKYVAKYLRSTLLEKLLKECSPSTYIGYKRMLETFPPPKLSLYIQLVNSARGIDAPILLPCALYRCCTTLSDDQVLDGIPRSSGEKLSLNAENKLLVLVAKAKLGHAARARVHQFVFFPSHDDLRACESIAECREFAAALARQIDMEKRMCGPFARTNWDAAASGLCKPCLLGWKESHRKGIQEVWGELPNYFGLPPWEELAKQSRWED